MEVENFRKGNSSSRVPFSTSNGRKGKQSTHITGGSGFKHFICLTLAGEKIQFDEHIVAGGIPPTSFDSHDMTTLCRLLFVKKALAYTNGALSAKLNP